MSDQSDARGADLPLTERVWAAGKVAAASGSGMAGLAIGATLAAAAAYALGSATATPSMIAGQIGNPMFLGAGAAAIGAGLSVIGAIPATVVGFVKSLNGTMSDEATGLKESLAEAWRSARDVAIYGSLASAAFAVGVSSSNYAADGGNGAVGLAVGVAAIGALIYGGAKTAETIGRAFESAGAAQGSEDGVKARAERQERERAQALQKAELKAASKAHWEGVGETLREDDARLAGQGPSESSPLSRLKNWREAKRAVEPAAPTVSKPGLGV